MKIHFTKNADADVKAPRTICPPKLGAGVVQMIRGTATLFRENPDCQRPRTESRGTVTGSRTIKAASGWADDHGAFGSRINGMMVTESLSAKRNELVTRSLW